MHMDDDTDLALSRTTTAANSKALRLDLEHGALVPEEPDGMGAQGPLFDDRRGQRRTLGHKRVRS